MNGWVFFMREFDYQKLAERTWDKEVLNYIGLIHEYKGRQQLYLEQKPEELDKLVELTKNQSTQASNEIEGIRTTNSRLKQLMADKTTPKNRDENEILGYSYALNLVHESFEYIPIRPNFILQLHKKCINFWMLILAVDSKIHLTKLMHYILTVIKKLYLNRLIHL